jgi:hypothetical protein
MNLSRRGTLARPEAMPIAVRCFALMLLSSLAGCVQGFTTTACTTELGIHFAPIDTVIAVGSSFTATVSLTTCGGREQVPDTVLWRAQDTVVVAVDSVAGRVTGRSTGHTSVFATGRRNGPLGGIPVIVAPASP